MKLFADYARSARVQVTTLNRALYPDYLEQALIMYEPVFRRFGELLLEASDSTDLLARINAEPNPLRTQLLRAFRKYVSPTTSVEMLKVGRRQSEILEDFASGFRRLEEVRSAYSSRPNADEALAGIFWEHHDRGTPGYEITTVLFDWIQAKFGDRFEIIGPKRSGQDVQLQKVLQKFRSEVPADFLIRRLSDGAPLVVGFAHYDSDRGGSQEDDRTAGNQDKVNKIMEYAARRRLPLKVLFVNDGPGLLLGSMWRDYAGLEKNNIVDDELRVMVVTLKMLDERVSAEWLES